LFGLVRSPAGFIYASALDVVAMAALFLSGVCAIVMLRALRAQQLVAAAHAALELVSTPPAAAPAP
jgi:hypothetical protein